MRDTPTFRSGNAATLDDKPDLQHLENAKQQHRDAHKMNRTVLRHIPRRVATPWKCICGKPCGFQVCRSSLAWPSLISPPPKRHISTSWAIKQQAQYAVANERGFDPQDEAVFHTTTKEASPPQGSLCIVFTDIVKSTLLWEKKPDAMAEAMRLHDSIVREYAAAHHGYEVKQNGDGFMMAFQSAVSALQFCLDIQQRLLDQEWPPALLDLSAGKETTDEDGHLLFRGLKLRMSAHWGEPVTVWNEVISRLDYLGPIANRAARFVQATEGGQIVVSEEFLLELQKAKADDGKQVKTGQKESNSADNSHDVPDVDLQALQCAENQAILTDQRFEVRSLGEHEFQGLEEPQKIFFIVPHSLRGRLDHWPRHRHIPGSKGNIIPNGG